MLRIYDVILDCLVRLVPYQQLLDGKDPDLARQLRRCSQSMALNTGEGAYSRKRNRLARYHTALGSARETLCCLEVGQAVRYFAEVDPVLLDELDRVIGTLTNIVKKT